MPHVTLLGCGLLSALSLAVACGQAKPLDSAQAAHEKLAPASDTSVAIGAPGAGDAAPSQDAAAADVAPCPSDPAPSPLAQAAFEGDVERARMLVVAAEQDAATRPGCAPTALMMAIAPYDGAAEGPREARERKLGKLDAAGLMLARCFDVAGAGPHGTTALHVAASAPYPEHILKRLIERMLECGATPNVADDQGVTPLMVAVKAKRKGLVRLLLENGADVGARSAAGESALGMAEQSRDRDLSALLKKPPTRDGG